jgi:uncharacterized membrane protein
MKNERINQPLYIKMVWWAVGVIVICFELSKSFGSPEVKAMMLALLVLAFLVATCVTLISNKIKFGACLPRARRRS